MSHDSNTRAFLADFSAMVFRVVPWAFPGLDEAERVECTSSRGARQLAGMHRAVTVLISHKPLLLTRLTFGFETHDVTKCKPCPN
jgi:hypothetical protein